MAEIDPSAIPTVKTPEELRLWVEAALPNALCRYHVGERAGHTLLGQMARMYWSRGAVHLVSKRLGGIISYYVVKRAQVAG